jgi:CheY-like chemotaxis protein
LGALDLVVTDRDMPGLDGLEFARRLHAISPAAKIVLVTAHNDDLTVAGLRLAGIAAVLPKPFSLLHLESVVRSLASVPVLTNAVCMASVERRAA